ncbi:MAG TPA: sigma-70 family RNA polymerase sigma factor [Planctomycetaceae bacterium]|nr:sigma-70 family RNA polymerase sigma factor [Planctomycetaceae bacterium]
MNSASQLDLAVNSDWAAFIHRHQRDVWRYLRALGCSPTQADDLTQETFLRVLERPFTEVDPRATAAYLRKVAYSRFVTECRRTARRPEIRQLEAVDRFWQRWVGSDSTDELIDHLRDCLEKLTDRARKALQLRYGEQASRKVIGAALQMSEHGAKNLLQRAKKSLRECIERRVRRSERESLPRSRGRLDS